MPDLLTPLSLDTNGDAARHATCSVMQARDRRDSDAYRDRERLKTGARTRCDATTTIQVTAHSGSQMTIVFLNGCTSAGKSSIARSLQDQLEDPYLLTGLDDALRMMPLRYHNHPEGFFFDRDQNDLVRFNLGDVGWATLIAHQKSAAAMARSGVNLILDQVVLTAEIRGNWTASLSGLDVLTVGVHCDVAELERREINRADRLIGQALGQLDLVHEGMRYDIEVDTTHVSPERAASQIVVALQ